MPRQRPPSYTLLELPPSFSFAVSLGSSENWPSANMADMARNSERHLGFTRSICVRLLNYLLMPAEGGRVWEWGVGKEALPVKCKGAISRMFDGPNLAFVCGSAFKSKLLIWIGPKSCYPCPAPARPLCCCLAKSARKQGLATCLCTHCPLQAPTPLPTSLPHLCLLQCCPLRTVCASYIMQHCSQANSLSTPSSGWQQQGYSSRGGGGSGWGKAVTIFKVSAKTHNAPSLLVALFGTSWRDEPFIFNTPSARYVIVILRANWQHNLPSPRDIRQPEDSRLTSEEPARGLKNNQRFFIFSCSWEFFIDSPHGEGGSEVWGWEVIEQFTVENLCALL